MLPQGSRTTKAVRGTVLGRLASFKTDLCPVVSSTTLEKLEQLKFTDLPLQQQRFSLAIMAFLPSFLLRFLLLGVAISLFITRLLKRKEKLPKGARLPPGPSGMLDSKTCTASGLDMTAIGVPVVGNLLDIPQKHSWVKFKVWADQYGPLMRLNLGGRDHYVVSNESIANDLLRERGNLYSSREQTPAAAQLLSGGLRPLLLPYNGVSQSGLAFAHLAHVF